MYSLSLSLFFLLFPSTFRWLSKSRYSDVPANRPRTSSRLHGFIFEKVVFRLHTYLCMLLNFNIVFNCFIEYDLWFWSWVPWRKTELTRTSHLSYHPVIGVYRGCFCEATGRELFSLQMTVWTNSITMDQWSKATQPRY